jgi:hypothetical protein
MLGLIQFLLKSEAVDVRESQKFPSREMMKRNLQPPSMESAISRWTQAPPNLVCQLRKDGIRTAKYQGLGLAVETFMQDKLLEKMTKKAKMNREMEKGRVRMKILPTMTAHRTFQMTMAKRI